ncbi:hypothetical protein A9404_07860 [Halothiobacillus diazotrophicus]|uniref:Thioredoxin domain-containing protein n=2 Tax=Halothiobacillus diazotrophicus TaxID=1860122 RepID=A0A191ZHE9_9GAMM|nr:hypothetical protein A9404_07860 [Halothiobacillus diazotrophicus]
MGVFLKRSMLMAVLLFFVNPVLAEPAGWRVFSDPSSLMQEISTEKKSGRSHFVVFFKADWAINSLLLEKKISDIDAKKFQGYSFFVFDMSQHRKDQLRLQHSYGVNSIPAVVVLNNDLKVVQGGRACGDVWGSAEQFSEWLKHYSDSTVKDGCETEGPTHFSSVVGVEASQDSDALLIRFDIPNGLYVPYDSISLKLGAINIEKISVSGTCALMVHGDPYFGDARFCKGIAEIRFDMKDLRHAGCKGKSNIILRYQKYLYSNRVLFPGSVVNIPVNCG